MSAVRRVTVDTSVAVKWFFALSRSYPASPFLTAYRLGVEHRQPIYDALFLAVGLVMDADAVTADESFYQAVRSRFPRVRWLAAWPPHS